MREASGAGNVSYLGSARSRATRIRFGSAATSMVRKVRPCPGETPGRWRGDRRPKTIRLGVESSLNFGVAEAVPASVLYVTNRGRSHDALPLKATHLQHEIVTQNPRKFSAVSGFNPRIPELGTHIHAVFGLFLLKSPNFVSKTGWQFMTYSADGLPAAVTAYAVLDIPQTCDKSQVVGCQALPPAISSMACMACMVGKPCIEVRHVGTWHENRTIGSTGRYNKNSHAILAWVAVCPKMKKSSGPNA